MIKVAGATLKPVGLMRRLGKFKAVEKINQLEGKTWKKRKVYWPKLQRQHYLPSSLVAKMSSLQPQHWIIVFAIENDDRLYMIWLKKALGDSDIVCVVLFAVRSVDARFSQEKGVKLGIEVSYFIRSEDFTSRKTIPKYLTNGIALPEILEEADLASYIVVMVDETQGNGPSTGILIDLVKDISFEYMNHTSITSASIAQVNGTRIRSILVSLNFVYVSTRILEYLIPYIWRAFWLLLSQIKGSQCLKT